jgi:oligoendopeptidase F
MTVEVETVPCRDAIPDRYQWDLTGVYADEALWEQDIARLEDQLPALATLRGELGQSAQSLLAALRLRHQVGIQLARMQTYAGHARDADSADPAAQARDERAQALAAKVQAALAFVEPDILALPPETIAAWLREEPRLQLYT